MVLSPLLFNLAFILSKSEYCGYSDQLLVLIQLDYLTLVSLFYGQQTLQLVGIGPMSPLIIVMAPVAYIITMVI